MKVVTFLHKGLKLLYEEDTGKGVPGHAVDKLRKMLSFLDSMIDPQELRTLSSWRAHTLTGDKRGMWSLSVTGNLRLTFHIDPITRQITDLDLQDYH